MPDSVAPVFRSLRLEPVTSSNPPRRRYELVIPLRADGRVDMRGWNARPTACRILRETPDANLLVGRLEPVSASCWTARYPDAGTEQVSVRLGAAVAPGELVTISSAGDEHVFRIVSQQPIG